MSFNFAASDLPITETIPHVRELLSSNNTLIVNAPPGAGKSTLLPLALLEEAWLNGKKIIMLEPRRLAARTIAIRMASLLGEEVGETIGYRIRFENRISSKTKLEVVTEGILTRMLHSDNALENYALVIFDEFHERSLHADLALALCREAQTILRPDLRIVIMSATLDMPQLTSLLKAPVAVSRGRQFDVEVIYTQDADPMLLPELTARTVMNAVSKYEGDVLVFLPGEGEIRKCETLLNGQGDFLVAPLYGQLSQPEQMRAIMPDKNKRRRIVLATSLAETSLTIEGIRIVVDSGFGRTSRFDPRSGLSKLETIRISKDSADQRAGRAGRLSSGVCYRMWGPATQSRLAENRIPEILEADLASLLLDLAAWGINNPESLSWLTNPPKASVSQANDTLHQINALAEGRITEHGKKILQLACHPRIAHMLLLAKTLPMQQLATDIAALLEERDPLSRDTGVDINLRIEALRRSRKNGGRSTFSRIEKVAGSYRHMLKIDEDNGIVDSNDTGLLLAYAYPERIASAKPGNNAQFQLANGKFAMFSHTDSLAHEPWISVANMDLREGMGKIFLAAPLNPRDLITMVNKVDNVVWDTRKGGLIATTELRIGSIVLETKPLHNPPAEVVKTALLEAIKKEGANLLDFNEEMEQLQNRLLSLREWNPEQDWPDASTATLLQQVELWLGPYLNNIKKTTDLKKIDLATAFIHSLEYEQQQMLNTLAPAKLNVPSGSAIRITYFPNGKTPVLSVRLQEVFGVAETPIINNGKTPLVMHLLSPGYKPVQVTSDLKSFWDTMYFEVKKELRRRYPKHAWPDDPWTATAVAKGRSFKK